MNEDTLLTIAVILGLIVIIWFAGGCSGKKQITPGSGHIEGMPIAMGPMC